MNRRLHRVIFNAARSMRIVVQQTANSIGKGASKATSLIRGAFAGAALGSLLAAALLHAQIVDASNVPGSN